MPTESPSIETADTSPADVALTGAEARRVARNAAAIAIARILSSAALFAWQLVLAPWLAPEMYGIYTAVMGLFAIAVPVASFSMGMIVIRDIAREPARAGQYLSATLFAQTLLSLLAYIGINLAASVLPGYTATIQAFVAVAGVSLFIDLVGNLCYDQLIAHEQMVITSWVDILHVVIRIGLAALLLASGFGLIGVYVATILSGLGRSVGLAVVLWRRGVRPQFPIDRALLLMLMINSAPLALSGFMSMAYQHADKLITTSMIGSTNAGYLGAAFVIIYGVVELLSTTILIATYPMMSRAYTENAKSSIFGFIVQKLSFFTLMISLPLTLVLSMFALDITLPLFGENFAQTASVLRVLIWYALLTMSANIFAQALMVQNRQRTLLKIRAFGLAVNIGLLLVFIPALGVTGAAWASVVAEAVVLVLMLRNFRDSAFDLRMMGGRLVRVGVLAALMIAVMALAALVHPFVGIIAGVIVYVIGAIFGGVLASDDWDLLYRLVMAMPGGAVVARVWKRDIATEW